MRKYLQKHLHNILSCRIFDISKELKTKTMKNAQLSKVAGMFFLAFFNSTEVFSVKGFYTERKAKNYAKKYGYKIFAELPEGIKEYQNWN